MKSISSVAKFSFVFFCLIPLFAVLGFFPTYFSGAVRPISLLDHAHGLAMFGWCAMLIIQSYLIRQGNRDIHRKVGKFSYVLVPFIAISTLALANERLIQRGPGFEGMYILMLQISLLALFLLCFGLAMRNRKRPDVHARYMICTSLTLLDPIFARLLIFNVLTPEQLPMSQYFTYGLTNLILIGLIVWDWRSSKRRDVFLPMLFVFIAFQLPTFFVVGTPAWAAFAEWYAGLPLS